MERAAASNFSPAAVAFLDGLGERHNILDPSGSETLEVLCVRDELAAVPVVRVRAARAREPAGDVPPLLVRPRARRRAADRSARHARHRLGRRRRHAPLRSPRPGGRAPRQPRHQLRALPDPQLVPAVAALHENARDIGIRPRRDRSRAAGRHAERAPARRRVRHGRRARAGALHARALLARAAGRRCRGRPVCRASISVSTSRRWASSRCR